MANKGEQQTSCKMLSEVTEDDLYFRFMGTWAFVTNKLEQFDNLCRMQEIPSIKLSNFSC